MNKVNCLICNEEVLYESESKERTCYFCKKTYTSSIVCKNGHYVCDECHSSDAFTMITNYCLNSHSTNPLEMAIDLMKMCIRDSINTIVKIVDIIPPFTGIHPA